MLATDVKTQKIEPDQMFFLLQTKVSEAVYNTDRHNVRSNTFLTCGNFGLSNGVIIIFSHCPVLFSQVCRQNV